MRAFFMIALFLMPIHAGLSESLDLDQLLEEVQRSRGAEGKINRERESRFLAEKNKQKEALATARAGLMRAEAASQRLKATFEANEAELVDIESTLKERSGVLDDLFAVARQAAGDLNAELSASITSAQFPGSGAFWKP